MKGNMYQIFFLLSLFLCVMAYNQNLACQGKSPVLMTKPYLYLEHNSIYIDSNDDFNTLGFPGLGTVTKPYLIENLNITDATTNLIFIRDTTVHFTIYDCLLNSTYGTVSEGIFLQNVKYCTIDDNIITNCNFGVRIDSSSDITVSHNFITHNKLSGIRTDFCSYITISNNSISHNPQGGIDLTASNYNNISNNIIFYHEGNNGIHLWNSSKNNIMGNDISHGTHGIHLHAVNNTANIISDNTFSYNSGGWGVNLDSIVVNTLVRGNDFIGNTDTAKDDGVNNIFKYNYWDDWTSPDNDGNGIVDDPYSIQGIANNQDLYPLTSPNAQPSPTSTTIPTTADTSMGTTPTVTPLDPLPILVGIGVSVIIRLNIRKKNSRKRK